MSRHGTQYRTAKGSASGARSGLLSRRLLTLLFTVVGLIMSVALYRIVADHREQITTAHFHLDAQQRATAIQKELRARLGTVDSLAAFYLGSEVVERDEFGAFSERFFVEDESLAALAWVERIPRSQREDHEQAVSEELNSAYRIVQFDSERATAPADDHEEYLPIVFLEPGKDNPLQLGLDLASIAAFRRIFEKASKFPESVAMSVPFPGGEGGIGLLVVHRVDLPKRGVDGFVMGLFRLDEILLDALSRMPTEGINVVLCASSASQEGSVLCVEVSDGKAKTVSPNCTDSAEMRYSDEFKLASSDWTVHCMPEKLYLAEHRDYGAFGVLIGGLFLTFAIAGYLVLLIGQTDRVERLVKERTEELRDSELRFRQLADYAADTFFLHDIEGNILDVNRQAVDSLGYTRDELLKMKISDLDVDAVRNEHVKRYWEPLTPDHAVTFRGTHRCKDGTTFPIEVRMTTLFSGGKQLFLGLVRNITDRDRAERALRDERRLLRELLILREQDRKLVAYEIHDGLAQQLTGAILKFQASQQLAESDPNLAKEMLDDGLRVLERAMKETRRLISDLRPPILDESGVVAAVESLIGEHQGEGVPKIEFEYDNRLQEEKLASPLEGAVYRIVQESLNNAVTHSKGTLVRIQLTQRGNQVGIKVEDDGVGFDVEKVKLGRFGLRGIHERARLLGGRVTIESEPGKGTRISVSLPVLEKVAGVDN